MHKLLFDNMEKHGIVVPILFLECRRVFESRDYLDMKALRNSIAKRMLKHSEDIARGKGFVGNIPEVKKAIAYQTMNAVLSEFMNIESDFCNPAIYVHVEERLMKDVVDYEKLLTDIVYTHILKVNVIKSEEEE